MVRGETDEKTAYIQARSFMARTLQINGKARQAEGEAKVVRGESSILKTHENCEGSISSTQRIRNSKKPSRTRVRSWKHQWLLLCPVKLSKVVGVMHPTKLKQNLRVFWKLMNPQECVWEIRYRIIMKTILQERGENSLQHYNLVHKFIPMPQAMKIPAARAAVDKEWEKLEKISAWNLTKVRCKSEVIEESKDVGRYSSFCIINGHMSSGKMLNWRQSTKSTTVELYSVVICKRRLRVSRSIH